MTAIQICRAVKLLNYTLAFVNIAVAALCAMYVCYSWKFTAMMFICYGMALMSYFTACRFEHIEEFLKGEGRPAC